MNPVALVQAWWAKEHITLAKEPPGSRRGLCSPPDQGRDLEPLTMLVVGDSMAVGCGVKDQSQGFVPDIAACLAARLGRPVSWSTQGRLGATIRRVRYRFLPALQDHPDLLVLCAGSNDIMANRTDEQWRDDLAASIELAKDKGRQVLVLSSGQLYRDPALGRALRAEVERRIARQTQTSRQVCQEASVPFVDATRDDVGTDRPDFWGTDHFHPGVEGYRRMAACVVDHIPQDLIDQLSVSVQS